MHVLVHKRMSISIFEGSSTRFEGSSTRFEGSSNASYTKNLLTFVPIGVNTCISRLQRVYKVHNFLYINNEVFMIIN